MRNVSHYCSHNTHGRACRFRTIRIAADIISYSYPGRTCEMKYRLGNGVSHSPAAAPPRVFSRVFTCCRPIFLDETIRFENERSSVGRSRYPKANAFICPGGDTVNHPGIPRGYDRAWRPIACFLHARRSRVRRSRPRRPNDNRVPPALFRPKRIK